MNKVSYWIKWKYEKYIQAYIKSLKKIQWDHFVLCNSIEQGTTLKAVVPFTFSSVAAGELLNKCKGYEAFNIYIYCYTVHLCLALRETLEFSRLQLSLKASSGPFHVFVTEGGSSDSSACTPDRYVWAGRAEHLGVQSLMKPRLNMGIIRHYQKFIMEFQKIDSWPIWTIMTVFTWTWASHLWVFCLLVFFKDPIFLCAYKHQILISVSEINPYLGSETAGFAIRRTQKKKKNVILWHVYLSQDTDSCRLPGQARPQPADLSAKQIRD